MLGSSDLLSCRLYDKIDICQLETNETSLPFASTNVMCFSIVSLETPSSKITMATLEAELMKNCKASDPIGRQLDSRWRHSKEYLFSA